MITVKARFEARAVSGRYVVAITEVNGVAIQPLAAWDRAPGAAAASAIAAALNDGLATRVMAVQPSARFELTSAGRARHAVTATPGGEVATMSNRAAASSVRIALNQGLVTRVALALVKAASMTGNSRE